MHSLYLILTIVQLVLATAYKGPTFTKVKVLREELIKRGLRKQGKHHELRARLAAVGGLNEDANLVTEIMDPNNIPTCRLIGGDGIFQLAVAFQHVLRTWVKERNQMTGDEITGRIEMPVVFAEAAYTEFVAVVNKKVSLHLSIVTVLLDDRRFRSGCWNNNKTVKCTHPTGRINRLEPPVAGVLRGAPTEFEFEIVLLPGEAESVSV
jgi:hypothetical protein